jgi:dTDP-4-amino-4,6-dideoxy-D-galactose acyltransferase
MENFSYSNFQILSWDSDFFGFGVGRILPLRLTCEELKGTLVSMKKENVTLVYWPSDPDDPDSQEAARKHGGFLADKKITYVIDLEKIPKQLVEEPDSGVKEYTRMETTDDLDNLAIQSGICSRYKVDPNIPAEHFEKLYKLWILKSVNRTLAENVFVSMDGEKIVGMVTVGMKNGRGDIGLVAIHESMRGKNVGVKLTRAAQKWAVGKGCRYAQVVTQGNNLAACKLYEKCGYRVESIVNFYHIWI